jgi:hypothetical protein
MSAQQKRSVIKRLSLVELLALATMCTFVVGFFIVRNVQRGRADRRTSSSMELAQYLQKARQDSMRRNATDVTQMAQIKMFNRNLYSVAIDGDGDNHLDIPLILTLPEDQSLHFGGPFPKVYIFNASGQTVDEYNNPMPPVPVTLTNNAGSSEIRFSENGGITVIPSLKDRS